MESIESDSPETRPDGRRGFLKGAVAWVLGAAALLMAPVSGLRVFLSPLRRQTDEEAGHWVRVTRLASLSEDGIPRRFPILADRVNAWNRAAGVPVGSVYLRRVDEGRVEAFNVVCPHAGCQVGYSSEHQGYLCPCHNSTFALDGSVNDPASPSPRGLDSLVVEIRDSSEVWIRFMNYRIGIKERVPMS